MLGVRVSGYSGEFPYWMAFLGSRTGTESSAGGTVKIGDSRAEEREDRNLPSRDHSAAIKMRSTNPAESDDRPACRSNVETATSWYIRRIDGCTGWPERRWAHQ